MKTDFIFTGRGEEAAGHPFKEGTARQNLRITSRGVRVRLAREISEMFEALPALGPVLSLSGTGEASLARIGKHPLARFRPASSHASPLGEGLVVDPARIHEAWATEEIVSGCRVFGFEFVGAWGEAIHKVCLTDDSDFGLFREIVLNGQPGGPERGLDRRAGAPAALGSGACVPGPDFAPTRFDFLAARFRAAVETGIPVETAVAAGGIQRTHAFVPLSVTDSASRLLVQGTGATLLHITKPRLLLFCSAPGSNGSRRFWAASPGGMEACLEATV